MAAGRQDAGRPRVKLYEGTKHTFASDALYRTGNERAVQEYLGHADLRSTERYAESSRTSDSSTW